jgi:hypothetical protein
VAGLAYKHWRGQSPTSDAWGGRSIRLITTVAVIWLTAEIVNLLWPRPVFSEWYLNWGSLIMTGVLAVLGAVICLWAFRRGAPAGDTERRLPVGAEADGA